MRLSAPAASLLRAAFVAALATLVSLPATAESAPLPAGELLRQAVAHQKIESSDYYTWIDRVQKPRGTATKLMLRTPQGLLARTVALNDKPLSAEDKQKEEQRLARLLDADNMREKAGKQRDDQHRAERVLAALPEAFVCQYASAAYDDSRIARLECDPAPGYQPPNYESQALQGMHTTILIDRDEQRLMRIEGTLFKDVSFGWGLIGRLYRGGHIEIAQSRVSPKFWGITRMALVFDGRAILVKRLHVEITEQSWDYRPVPAMDVAQALDYLKARAAKLEGTSKLEPPK